MWSIFEHEFKTKVNDKYQWVKEFIFYKGDLSEEDFENDSRFKEIKDKRKQVKFLGTLETEFPIVFPLTLNNGMILEDTPDIYHRRSYREDDEHDD